MFKCTAGAHGPDGMPEMDGDSYNGEEEEGPGTESNAPSVSGGGTDNNEHEASVDEEAIEKQKLAAMMKNTAASAHNGWVSICYIGNFSFFG